MSLDREKLAMLIHKGTTQNPGTTPHECDYETADTILRELNPELPVSACQIWDVLVPNDPRKTGFGIFSTGDEARSFLDRLNEHQPTLSDGYVIKELK
jgi:hypothetical protein